jgi:uncharacterized protein
MVRDSDASCVTTHAIPSAEFRMFNGSFPPVLPGLLRGGHVQTLAGYYLPSLSRRYTAVRHTIVLPDGDEVVLHDDCPSSWGPCSPFVVLMHGLAGCHQSGYMIRIAARLTDCGIRVFRLDHRGAGAAACRAKHPYHAGRSEDVREALFAASQLCPGSMGGIAGFSLSGNMLLKMLGEDAVRGRVPQYLSCAVAVNPPIDLEANSAAMKTRLNRRYDRHFTELLVPQVRQRLDTFPDAPRPLEPFTPKILREFDTLYTAPVSGFSSVEDYYRQSSAAPLVPSIATPTLILTAEDDPMIPVKSFRELPDSPAVTLHIARHGGHLGYLSRRGRDPDRRWMDWRVIDWFASHLRFVVSQKST